MDTSDLLKKVKISLGIADDYSDEVLKQKILEARAYIAANGVSEGQLSTELGTAAVVAYVNDTWVIGGEIKFSSALPILLSLLYTQSRVDEGWEND